MCSPTRGENISQSSSENEPESLVLNKTVFISTSGLWPDPPLYSYQRIHHFYYCQGNLCQRGGKAVWACLIGCCHDCKTMDKVIFVFHILLIVAGLAVGTVTTLSKMSTHNQCYLKAHYHSDGSMVRTISN